MAVAFGDHQVAPITARNIARTLGIPIYQPALPPGATIARQPFYGLDPIRSFPQIGSALYYWDSGALAPPLGNITPTMSERSSRLCTGANEVNQDSGAVRGSPRGSASPARDDRAEAGLLPACRRDHQRLRRGPLHRASPFRLRLLTQRSQRAVADPGAPVVGHHDSVCPGRCPDVASRRVQLDSTEKAARSAAARSRSCSARAPRTIVRVRRNGPSCSCSASSARHGTGSVDDVVGGDHLVEEPGVDRRRGVVVLCQLDRLVERPRAQPGATGQLDRERRDGYADAHLGGPSLNVPDRSDAHVGEHCRMPPMASAWPVTASTHRHRPLVEP